MDWHFSQYFKASKKGKLKLLVGCNILGPDVAVKRSDLIDDQFQTELEDARIAWLEALVTMNRLIDQTPWGLPRDGLERLEEAGVHLRFAGAAYLAALDGVMESTISGRVSGIRTTVRDTLKS